MQADNNAENLCADLTWRLERLIVRRTWGRIRGLRVDATPERVVVAGSAPSYYLKQLVLAAVSESLAGTPLCPAVAVDIQVISAVPALA